MSPPSDCRIGGDGPRSTDPRERAAATANVRYHRAVQKARCARRWLPALAALLAARVHASPVIPPGNEKLFAALLGTGKPLPAGCRLTGATIEQRLVVAEYACGEARAIVELHHPAEAPDAGVKTERFALVPRGDVREALLEAVESRVRAGERAFAWSDEAAAPAAAGAPSPSGQPPPPSGQPPRPPPAPSDLVPNPTPAQMHAYEEAERRFRAGDYDGSLAAAVALVRATLPRPVDGALGLVVSSVASTSPGPDQVAGYAAAADARPADPLANFIAGVAAHYCGHRHGRTREEKARYYAAAIRYLERARPAFDFEPRLWLYLAVSHHRLGERAEAERLIEHAVTLARQDPDIYYCRAEIFAHEDLGRSVEDVRTYLAMTEALHRQGVPLNPQKHARVEAMLANLEAAARGAPLAEDLWDPLARRARSPLRGALAATGGALVVALALFVALRRSG
jgi:hypothetical protein